MARLRFPGRPGNRVGRNAIKFYSENKIMKKDSILNGTPSSLNNWQIFHETFGPSDDEEDFEGFSLEELNESLHSSQKRKEKITKNYFLELSSPEKTSTPISTKSNSVDSTRLLDAAPVISPHSPSPINNNASAQSNQRRRRQFILPTLSKRSARKIIPKKEFIDFFSPITKAAQYHRCKSTAHAADARKPTQESSQNVTPQSTGKQTLREWLTACSATSLFDSSSDESDDFFQGFLKNDSKPQSHQVPDSSQTPPTHEDVPQDKADLTPLNIPTQPAVPSEPIETEEPLESSSFARRKIAFSPTHIPSYSSSCTVAENGDMVQPQEDEMIPQVDEVIPRVDQVTTSAAAVVLHQQPPTLDKVKRRGRPPTKHLQDARSGELTSRMKHHSVEPGREKSPSLGSPEPPGTIICKVCGLIKFLAHVQQPNCDQCHQFFVGFLKQPQQFYCTNTGYCSLRLSNAGLRCHACWLKACLHHFPIPQAKLSSVQRFLPRRTDHIPLITAAELLKALPGRPPSLKRKALSLHKPNKTPRKKLASPLLLPQEEANPPPAAVAAKSPLQDASSSPKALKTTQPRVELIRCDDIVPTWNEELLVPLNLPSESPAEHRQAAPPPPPPPESPPSPKVLTKKSSGPRIKHVCRRADLVVGGPVRAKFSELPIPSVNLSALPPEEKNKIMEKVTDDMSDSENSPKLANGKFGGGKKSRHNSDSFPSSPFHLPEKKFTKHLPIRNKRRKMSDDEDESDTSIQQPDIKRPRFRKVRCKNCDGCLAEDCGKCINCQDKKKFGGPNIIRRACIHRRCTNPLLPLNQDPVVPKPPSKGHGDQDEPSGAGGNSSMGSTHRNGHLHHSANHTSSSNQTRSTGGTSGTQTLSLKEVDVNWLYDIIPLAKLFKEQPDEKYQKAFHPVKILVTDEETSLNKLRCQGHAVVGTKNGQKCSQPYLCYVCGSLGQEELVFCSVCCEPYHPFCLCLLDRPVRDDRDGWCCRRCVTCSVCGEGSNLLKCSECHHSYHPGCMGINYPSTYSPIKKKWLCCKCVRCSQCKARCEDPDYPWNFDMCLCPQCHNIMGEEGLCHICNQLYKEDSSLLLYCIDCCAWVHAKCNNIQDGTATILREYQLDFTCLVCEDMDPSWKIELQEKLSQSFTRILELLELEDVFNSRCHEVEDNEDLLLVDITPLSDDDDAITFYIERQNMLMGIERSSYMTGTIDDFHNRRPDCLRSAIEELELKIEEGKYILIEEFCVDIMRVIQTFAFNRAKFLHRQLAELLQEEFPWYHLDLDKYTSSPQPSPPVVPPYNDHFYARPSSEPDHPVRQDALPQESEEPQGEDTRKCQFCRKTGEEDKLTGRLLYIGQDEWSHLSCAFWSAEVLLEDCVLLNVHDALSRSRFLRCGRCKQRGATVGCCIPECRANYHFPCSLLRNVTFQSDKRVFCSRHYSRANPSRCINIDNWRCEKPVVVQPPDSKSLKRSWQEGFDPEKYQIRIGALTIENLGHLSESSEAFDTLVPVNFKCTRLFWSTQNPAMKVPYTIQTVEEFPEEEEEKEEAAIHQTLVHHNMLATADALTSFLSHMYKGSISSLLLHTNGKKKHLNHILDHPASKRYQSYVKSLSLYEYLNLLKLRQKVSSLSLSRVLEEIPQISQKIPTDLWHSLRIALPLSLVSNGSNGHRSYSLPLFSSALGADGNSYLNGGGDSFSTSGSSSPYTNGAEYSAQLQLSHSLLPPAAHSPHSNSSTPPLLNNQNNLLDDENGPFKCPNCKRFYRTTRSFQKHVQFCDFVIDSTSSSDEDEPMDTSQVKESAVSVERPSVDPRVVPPAAAAVMCDNPSPHAVMVPPSTSLVVSPASSLVTPPPIMQLPPTVMVPSYLPTVFPPGYTLTTPLSYLGSITVSSQAQLSSMQIMPPISVVPVYNPIMLATPAMCSPQNMEGRFAQLGFDKPMAEMIEKAARQMLKQPPNNRLKGSTAHVPIAPAPQTKNTLASTASSTRKPPLIMSAPSQTTPLVPPQPDPPIQLSEPAPEKEKSSPPPPPSQQPPTPAASKPAKKPKLIFEVRCDDGYSVRSTDFTEAWKRVLEKLQDARSAYHLKRVNLPKESTSQGTASLGLKNDSVGYMTEQLKGAEECNSYNFSHFKPWRTKELPICPSGCIRCEPFRPPWPGVNQRRFTCPVKRAEVSSDTIAVEDEVKSRRNNSDLPLPMRFRLLKTAARDAVTVCRSPIHGKGLFSTRALEPGDMIIEYAGEMIRSVLTDKREQHYLSRGIGCYMFRLDDDWVVDATMQGNAARFINHSCDPNCYSKVLQVDGTKHILIFALRKIQRGDELTYDYKFPLEEEDKIPCQCRSRKCRKYLN